MRPALSVVKHDRAECQRIAFLLLPFFLMPVVCKGRIPLAERVFPKSDKQNR